VKKYKGFFTKVKRAERNDKGYKHLIGEVQDTGKRVYRKPKEARKQTESYMIKVDDAYTDLISKQPNKGFDKPLTDPNAPSNPLEPDQIAVPLSQESALSEETRQKFMDEAKKQVHKDSNQRSKTKAH